MALYIGLMSGTSLDGVDAVLAEWPDDAATAPGPALRVHAHRHVAFGEALREELLQLNRSGVDELHRAALAANALMRTYASAVRVVLDTAGRRASELRAIGAHGQTVRHRPQAFDGTGYTLQLVNGALLAELTGVDVVCDFRSRDVAAGGQGAPLVPAFHAAVFGAAGREVAILNLGGMANLTLLHADSTVRGFDCGPGNVLLDLWCRRHLGQPYDDAGRWAASGRVDPSLLGRLLAEPFLDEPPPKSTGRDLFHADWLDAAIGADRGPLRPEDVQATLAEFSARAAADALKRHAPGVAELLVCGGGARNADLTNRLAALLPTCVVEATDRRGVPAEQVEALAFAWLARSFVERRPANLPAVTGARGPRLLGALYPA